MKINIPIGVATALLLSPTQASHHRLSPKLDAIQRRHHHSRKAHSSPTAEVNGEAITGEDLKKRGTQCPFPSDAGLIAITPDQQNAGWAMSPDQPCEPGTYCPYACPAGQVSMQWDPEATSYSYPQSMNGGLYCDENGDISKPFPSKPYCADGTGALGVTNNAGAQVAFCQTVLPGNEAMLIPTSVDAWSQLAVPGTDYWCSTAAHFYINPPGVSIEDGCIWGDGSQPVGNWSPYVTGANTDSNGDTFAKIAWNPIYTDSGFASVLPDWGVSIECDGEGCNGLPCSIDPATNSVNEVTSADQASGAGGANFCVVTIPRGVTANVVVFKAGGSSSGGGSSSSSVPSSSVVSSTFSSASPSSTLSYSSSSSPSTTPASSSSTSSSISSTSISSSSSSAPSSSSSSSAPSTSSLSSSATYASSSSSTTPTSFSYSGTAYSSSAHSPAPSNTRTRASNTASSSASATDDSFSPTDSPHVFAQQVDSTPVSAVNMVSLSSAALETTASNKKATSDAPSEFAVSTAFYMVVFLATAVSVLL